MTIESYRSSDIFCLERAEEILINLENEFLEVRRKYSGFRNWFTFKKYLENDDNQVLYKCLETLAELSLTKPVQTEAKKSRKLEEMEETVEYKCAELSLEILDYLCGFENSGIRKIKNTIFGNVTLREYCW